MLKKVKIKVLKIFFSKEKYARHIGVNIGDGCSINTTFFGSEPYLISIGNRVQITERVCFFTHGSAWVFREKYPHLDFFGKIKIGNNVYIGNDVKVMPGVTIGDNVVIAAGSIVTKSFDSNSVIGGCPAKYLKPLEDLEKSILPYNLKTYKMSRKEKREYLLMQNDSKFLRK